MWTEGGSKLSCRLFIVGDGGRFSAGKVRKNQRGVCASGSSSCWDAAPLEKVSGASQILRLFAAGDEKAGTLDYSLCSRNVSWGFFSGFSLRLQETDSRRTAWIAQSDESVAYAIYMSFP